MDWSFKRATCNNILPDLTPLQLMQGPTGYHLVHISGYEKVLKSRFLDKTGSSGISQPSWIDWVKQKQKLQVQPQVQDCPHLPSWSLHSPQNQFAHVQQTCRRKNTYISLISLFTFFQYHCSSFALLDCSRSSTMTWTTWCTNRGIQVFFFNKISFWNFSPY